MASPNVLSPFFHQRTLKVLILGDSNVGKTAILNQFVNREFTSAYQATIGSDFTSRQIEVDGKFVTLQVWDTAGQERYRSLASTFYRQTDICVLVYDTTSEQSFEDIDFWHRSFDSYCTPLPPQFPYLLLGNKLDDPGNRQVSKERGQLLAEQRGFLFFEVSAKLCENLNEAFEQAVRKAFEGAKAAEQKVIEGGVVGDLAGNQPAAQKCQC
jgi:Ras-related protein Rab-7A